LLAPAADLATITPTQAAACIKIKTPADLDAVRNDLTGHYCLARDIDMRRVRNFVPLGELPDGFTDEFTGTFDGKGHTIRNLTIVSAGRQIGLFAKIDSSGSMKNLVLQNASVSGVSSGEVTVGTVAGLNFGSISNVRAGGQVRAPACTAVCVAGGLVGASWETIVRSSAAVSVTVAGGGDAGGLLGNLNAGSIVQSYATGAVSMTAGGGFAGAAGGLVGRTAFSSVISQSFATGPVSLGQPAETSHKTGGLVGEAQGCTIVQSFATGSVDSAPLGLAGGLIGYNDGCNNRQVYALGSVTKDTDASTGLGGLVAEMHGGSVAHGYWDVDTSGQTLSAAGTPKTTPSLQARLPRGFRATKWSITPNISFPYLTAGLDFAAPLAITVKDSLLYTFLPISQLDRSQYTHKVKHEDEASLAAAYTIIARAIGVTNDVDGLKDVAIDTDFWDDASETATWTGPVTGHATRGPRRLVASRVKLDEGNVIGALRARQVVLLRGKYRREAGGKATQWMVATSFTTDAQGNVTAVVADDPWTGLQVRIDPATKRVVAPADFPLAHFTVNAFQTVTLN
jgi:hypothetical protein